MASVLTEAVRLTRLIDALLLLARADSGENSLQMEPTDVRVSLCEACEQCRVLAAEKQIELHAPDFPRPAVVAGDPEALRRVFFILIENAVKYTPPGGRVEVTLDPLPSNIAVSVRDTGIGIAKEDQPRIFDRFWRADKVRSRGAGGAGLGLSIARWIVERHGGRIEATSTPGAGSRFTVNLSPGYTRGS
jgi:signal transduction histidine kinase